MGLFSNNNVDNQIIDLYKQKKVDILQFLLDNTLINNLAISDHNNNTILHYIVINRDYECLKFILDYIKKTGNSSVLNAQNNDGNTPFHIAVKLQDKYSSTLLDNAGASKYIKNNDGEFIKFDPGQFKTKESRNIFQSIYDSLFQNSDTIDSIDIPADLDQIDTVIDLNNVRPKINKNLSDEYDSIFLSPTENTYDIKNKEIDQFINSIKHYMNKYNNNVSNIDTIVLYGGDKKYNDNDATIIHNEVVNTIIKRYNVPIDVAKGYKAILYKHVKDNFADLNNLSRAQKMKDILNDTKDDFFEKFKKSHTKEFEAVIDTVKKIMKEKQERPKKEHVKSTDKKFSATDKKLPATDKKNKKVDKKEETTSDGPSITTPKKTIKKKEPATKKEKK